MLDLLSEIANLYQASASKCVQKLSFGDNDLNCSSLVSLLTRLVLQKCDKTEVNLNGIAPQAVKATQAFRSVQPSSSIFAYFNELEPSLLEDYLTSILNYLQAITHLPMFAYFTEETKASLELNLVNVLSVSSLKLKGSAISEDVYELLMQVSSNVVALKGVKD